MEQRIGERQGQEWGDQAGSNGGLGERVLVARTSEVGGDGGRG